MYYDKRIRYIDYLENGEKRRNCGYVKITVTGGRLLLEMQVKGLYATDDVASDIMLEGMGEEHRIGTVIIRQGSGIFQWEIQDPTHQGEEILLNKSLSYGRLERIAVHLSSRRSLYCIWRELEAEDTSVTERMAENAVQKQKLQSDEVQQPGGEDVPDVDAPLEISDEERAEAYIASEPEDAAKLKGSERPAGQPEWEKPKRSEGQIEQEEATGEEGDPEQEGATKTEKQPEQGQLLELSESQTLMESEAQSKPEEPLKAELSMEPQSPKKEELHTAESQRRGSQEPPAIPMSEDKWQQLQRIYPHIRPFQDEREYLSLRPEDFVILRSNAYRLVQNSFLLHGYYNYKHLILTHVPQRNAGQYYIGVPGNFYEKEKQVAIMYGFDSFECKSEPAEDGDFGYYMIKVEL